MINLQDITDIGSVTKTHGVRGEMSLALGAAYFGVDPEDLRCLVFMMDGIPVPFFIDTCRTRGSESFLVKLDGVDDEQQAAAFVGKDVWAFRDDLVDEESADGEFITFDDLIGYTLEDSDATPVGEIIDVDDSTENLLFVVQRNDGAEVLVPAASELVLELNPTRRVIKMNLPTGLY